jgi:L-ornithine Nalpha-acyltransferase
MKLDLSRYVVKLAESDSERLGAQRLRYRVFVEEMGASVSAEERALRREWDDFDPFFEHVVLLDRGPGIEDPLDRVVGAYRVMPGWVAAEARGFYGASEYDLSPLETCGRRVLELGRSCVAREHRGGSAMHLLWNGLAKYVLDREIEILFGLASLRGTDPEPYAEALAYLHHFHLAPEDLRVRARANGFVAMDRMSKEAVEPARALRSIPPLIQAYLRLGGYVGEGAFVDRDFNTIDVCLLMDTGRMTARYRSFYERNWARGSPS